ASRWSGPARGRRQAPQRPPARHGGERARQPAAALGRPRARAPVRRRLHGADRVSDGPRRKRYKAKEVGLAAAFLAPSMAVFAVFFYLPFIKLLGWGRYKSERGGATYRDVGFDQYKDLLLGDVFKDGFWH